MISSGLLAEPAVHVPDWTTADLEAAIVAANATAAEPHDTYTVTVKSSSTARGEPSATEHDYVETDQSMVEVENPAEPAVTSNGDDQTKAPPIEADNAEQNENSKE